jgi:hypothetical protein
LRAKTAAALYLLIALVFTWPLARGLARDIPWDLGDSLLNCWILQWDLDHLTRFLSGHPHAMNGFWTGNIFYPEPLTLAYSEHLFAQAVQVLPVYALTHNIILCYNVLFLSTFVLSGLGMFLFAREVTGSPRAGFVAGLLYAFAPLRVPQFAHLQVISSQWMPFALYGLRRYFEKRDRESFAAVTGAKDSRSLFSKPLFFAGLALVAQNLSCGYFLMFFAPCVVAYILFEIASRKLWTDFRMWTEVGATGVVVALLTLPFLLPYLELRRLGFPPRAYAEVISYSADVYSYWTSPAESRLWGHAIRAFPKPEGDLFPSITALVLAAAGLFASVRSAWAQSRGPAAAAPPLTIVVLFLAAVSAVYGLFLVLILTGHGFIGPGPVPISVKSLVRNFQILLALLIVLLVSSPRARSFAARWAGSVAGVAVLLAAATFVLSLGPEIQALGKGLRGTAPYAFLFWHVPGFDGLRVPARYGMLAMLFLSIVAAFGALEIERRFRRSGLVILMLAGVFCVAESIAAPIVINGQDPIGGYQTPPARMMIGDQSPAVYRYLATLPPGTVVAEFPFGEWAYELRYMFYSPIHWHPLINGYSGTFPLGYHLRANVLRRPEEDPDAAWNAMVTAGTTHAVVHEGFFKADRAKVVSAWLTSEGARLAGDFDGDKVFVLR